MARKPGAINFPKNFNITAAAPIDSRMVLDFESDLISSATWADVPLYNGLTVATIDTASIWVLKDETKYTDKTTGEGWVKVGDVDIDEIRSLIIKDTITASGSTYSSNKIEDKLSLKQDTLIAGDYIQISGNTISVDKLDDMTFVIASHIHELRNTKQDLLTAGSGVTIDDNVISVSNENSWREIKVNGNTFLSSATTSGALTLSAGTNVVLTARDGVVTINSEGGGGGGTTTYYDGDNIVVNNTNHTINAIGYTFNDTTKSFSESIGNTATGTRSHAEGYLTTASGYSSHAEGYSTVASGHSAHAEGLRTNANGNYSHAEGTSTVASGSYSHAEGSATHASGLTSHAEGANTDANGTSSHAEGSGTTSGGLASHAEGGETFASGDYSHAEGSGTTASALYSHAGGLGTTANQPEMTAIGKYNADGVQGELFTVGNGTASEHSSCFKIVGNTNNTTCNVNINGNTSTTGVITSQVNGVSDVYLGCPVGTSLMWMGDGNNVPTGWRLCDGYGIAIQIVDDYYHGKTIKKYCWIRQDGYGIPRCTNEMVNVATYADNFQDYINLIGVIGSYYTYENWFTYNGQKYYYGLSNSIYGETATTSSIAAIFNNGNAVINLPNLQQRFPLGSYGTTSANDQWSCGSVTYHTRLAQTGGTKEVTLAANETGMQSHTHAISFLDGELNTIPNRVVDTVGNPQLVNYTGGGSGTAGSNVTSIQISRNQQEGAVYNGVVQMYHYGKSGTAYEAGEVIESVPASSASNAHNNIPPYLAVNFIIKYM